MSSKVTVPLLRSRKVRDGHPAIVALTAYDYSMAKIIDDSGVDCILVGDSLGNIIQGASHTISVTLEEMIYHCRCVANASPRSLLIGDLPFLSYQISNEQALESSGRLLKEGKVEAVKLEGGTSIADRIATITKYDIPVMAHIGLTPQSFHRMGGHKKQGISKPGARSATEIIEDAQAVQEAGAFAVVLEGLPEALAEKITLMLEIPTIGIAAGAYCDGQILVSNDLFGLSPLSPPPFVRPMLNLQKQLSDAVRSYAERVQSEAMQKRKIKVHE